MNKTIAFLIIGVVLLAMALIMVNQYMTPAQPPEIGAAAEPPQTAPAGQNGAALTPVPPPGAAGSPAQGLPGQTPGAAQQPPALPQWAANATERLAPPTGSPLEPRSPESADARPHGSLGDSGSAVTQPVTPPPPAPKAQAQPPQGQSPQAQASQAQTPPAKAAPKAPAAKPAPAKASGPKTIKKIVVSGSGDTVTVRIEGSEALAYKTMHLKGPERLVVDLEGVWAIKAPGVPANKYVSNVRIGKQTDKTRVVIDLRATPGGVNFVKRDADTLEVRIK